MSQSLLFDSSPLSIIVMVNGYRQYYCHHYQQQQRHHHRHHHSRDVLDHLRRYLQSMIVKIGTDV